MTKFKILGMQKYLDKKVDFFKMELPVNHGEFVDLYLRGGINPKVVDKAISEFVGHMEDYVATLKELIDLTKKESIK